MGGGVSALPSRLQPLNPPMASLQVQREAKDRPAHSLPSHLQWPTQERGLLRGGSPSAVRLWKLCRLRLWNSSTGLLQLIITAPWIPYLGL